MKILELFAGSRSIGKAATNLGFEVFSSDFQNFNGIDYIENILNFDCSKVPFIPDIIWASPPCEKWSLACGVEGGNIYWESVKVKGKVVGIKPRENFNVKARYSILKNPLDVATQRQFHVDILEKTLDIINHFQRISDKPLVFMIENPLGFMQYHLKGRVKFHNICTYCQYGFPYRKPTNIFSNIELNLKTCKIGSECHSNNLDSRGKENKLHETAIVKNYYNRSKIPQELCLDVLKQAQIYLTNK